MFGRIARTLVALGLIVAGADAQASLVAAGGNHTCAVLIDGRLACWGSNSIDQIGAAEQENYATPQVAPFLRHARALALGRVHSCALTAQRTVACWGSAALGATGSDGDGELSTPEPFEFQLTDIGEIATGDDFGCALRRGTGTVACWGDNHEGQLGRGLDVNQSPFPQEINGIANAVAIGAGARHACAVNTSAQLLCWGDNTDGQLGLGAVSAPINEPRFVDGLTEVLDVAGGDKHTCAVRRDGSVWCWGKGSDYGQLGVGAYRSSTIPLPVNGLDDAIAVDAGTLHTCALRRGGKVSCWGNGYRGEVGTGGNSSYASPQEIAGLVGVESLSVGDQHTCVLRETGAILCWGDGEYGRLGTGDLTDDTGQPQLVEAIDSITSIVAGELHTCALREGGQVFCWGRNDEGQLGAPVTLQASGTPLAVAGIGGATRIVSGRAHVCAVLADETVRCWGSNDDRQAGVASPAAVRAPVQVAIANVVDIAAGSGHTCAATRDGFARCWGRNNEGELGVGTVDAGTATPVPVVGLTNVSKLTAGDGHTCALDGERAFCWGFNGRGQLGIGTTSISEPLAAPVQFDGAPRTLSVLAADDRTFAVRPATVRGPNETFAWGDNDDDVLGIAGLPEAPIMVPQRRPNSEPVIGAGFLSACSGFGTTVSCWGNNAGCKLGGDCAFRNAPTRAPQFDRATQIAFGASHACVLRDGSVYCTGSAEWGQRGDGVITYRAQPAVVTGIVGPIELVLRDGFESANDAR